MIGVRYNWIIGCDAHMEQEEMSNNLRFHKLRAVIVATE